MTQVKLDLDTTLGPAKELDLQQGRLRYRERGSGPPILFVHGLLVNGALWRNVVDELAPDARCITPDWPLGSHELPLRPGSDRTPAGMARLIADTMEALDLQDVTLVGNDSGGALCQMVVTSHPERVGRLVLTDCDAFDNFPPRMFSYLLWASRVPAALGMLLQSMRLRFMRQAPIAFGWLSKRPLPPGVSDAYALPILRDKRVRDDAAAFMVGLHKSDLNEVTARLGDFKRPVLIAWAPEDRFFPFEHGERLASIFPDSRLERIEDSRTFVSEDQPKRLAELIAGFVREPAISDRKGALT